MKFEEWGKELDQERHIPAAEMYADWKAERESYMAALKGETTIKEKFYQDREKLIGALEDIRFHIAQSELFEADTIIHAILQEVKV